MKFKLTESFEKEKYTYIGPVYGNNGLIAQEVKKTTYATSKNQAANNIKYQLYKELGSRVDIDVSKIYSQVKPTETNIADKDIREPEQLSFF